MSKYHVKLTLTEPMLGSAPAEPTVYEQFIAAKRIKKGVAPAALIEQRKLDHDKVVEEELAMLPEPEGNISVFRRKDGNLVMMDFQIRGFLKEAAEAIDGVWGSRSKIDKWLFVSPRAIPIMRDGKPLAKPNEHNNERPLRANTMQGPRVALASSEEIAEGVTLDFDITCLPLGVAGGPPGAGKKTLQMTKERICSWLDYGALNGLGQWRTGSYGRFTYEISQLSE
jgi:hypothetical protein